MFGYCVAYDAKVVKILPAEVNHLVALEFGWLGSIVQTCFSWTCVSTNHIV